MDSNRYVPLGTGEINYVLPSPPVSREEVLFAKEKPADQFWRRQKDLPKIFYDYNWFTKLWQENTRYSSGTSKLLSLSHEDSKTFIYFREREMRRRVHGVHFMNNGKLDYMTGGHYFILQWGVMADVKNEDGEPYGGHRRFQKEVGYFMDHCKKDSECVGGFIIKPKKTGLTQYIALDYLDESTRTKDKHFGMMSKVLRPDCVETNMEYYLHGYDNLPYALRPRYGKRTQTQIKFKPQPPKGISEDAMASMEAHLKGLNTDVFAAPTKANAFDGPKMYRAWYDEFPKYKKPNGPAAIWAKGSQVVKEQRQINGKVWISSYPPEDDTEEFLEARNIYMESKQSTRDEVTKRTMTELYVHYISTIGSEQGSFDRYGESDENTTRVQMHARRKQLSKDDNALQQHMRQYSETEEEAWRLGGGGGTAFDNARFGERELRIKLDNAGMRAYIEGNLRFVDGSRLADHLDHYRRTGEHVFPLVEFVQLTSDDIMRGLEGKFRWYGFGLLNRLTFNMPVMQQIRHKKTKLLMPATDARYVMAMDPTDMAESATVLQGSKNAISAMILPDMAWNTHHGRDVTDRFIVDYLYRDKDVNVTYQDYVLLMLFLGAPGVVEGNKPWVTTKLVQDGFEHFLLMRTKERTLEMYDRALVASGKQVYPTLQRGQKISDIEDLVRDANIFWKKPQHDGEVDNLQKLDSIRQIDQYMKLNTENTKVSDACIGSMWNIQARNAIMAIRGRNANAKPLYNKQSIAEVLRQHFDQ